MSKIIEAKNSLRKKVSVLPGYCHIRTTGLFLDVFFDPEYIKPTRALFPQPRVWMGYQVYILDKWMCEDEL